MALCKRASWCSRSRKALVDSDGCGKIKKAKVVNNVQDRDVSHVQDRDVSQVQDRVVSQVQDSAISQVQDRIVCQVQDSDVSQVQDRIWNHTKVFFLESEFIIEPFKMYSNDELLTENFIGVNANLEKG